MKKFLENNKLLLALIFVVSLFFRFYKLADFPVSLSIDEVIIGYDSYSLLETGKDHWGEKLPLAFKSIGDYKPPVLIYLMIPAIKFLGLNEFGIRFTIALVGSITPLVVFFIIDFLTRNKKIAFITALLVSISPWHINFSRSTFEAILALFFMFAGVLVFLKSKKGKYWWVSGLLFSLSMYSYHAQRVFIPLFLVALLVIFFNKIRKNRKNAIVAVVASFVFLIPFFQLMFSSKGQTRAKDTIFLNDYEFATVKMEKVNEKNANFTDVVLSSKPIHAFSFWAKRYLEYSDLDYLFFSGMSYTHEKYPNIGVMHYFELIFFIWGLKSMINGGIKLSKQNKKLIFTWLFLGPVPATLAGNSQHPLRSLTTIPIPQLITAIGIYQFFHWVKKFKKSLCKIFALFAFSLSVLISLVYYLNIYYIHYPMHFSHYIMYGMDKAAKYAWENREKYDKIVFDAHFGVEDKNITGIPFAYVLTKGRVNPHIIQEARRKNEEILKIDNIEFREVNWTKDSNMENALLIASFWQLNPDSIPEESIVKEFPLYNGTKMFYLVETEK